MGRWGSRDPIGYADGQNLLIFTTGNPLSLVDPTGFQTITTMDIEDPGLWFPPVHECAESLDDLIAIIKAKAGSDGCIDKLVIDAHCGVPGLVMLSRRRDDPI